MSLLLFSHPLEKWKSVLKPKYFTESANLSRSRSTFIETTLEHFPRRTPMSLHDDKVILAILSNLGPRKVLRWQSGFPEDCWCGSLHCWESDCWHYLWRAWLCRSKCHGKQWLYKDLALNTTGKRSVSHQDQLKTPNNKTSAVVNSPSCCSYLYLYNIFF